MGDSLPYTNTIFYNSVRNKFLCGAPLKTRYKDNSKTSCRSPVGNFQESISDNQIASCLAVYGLKATTMPLLTSVSKYSRPLPA